MTRHKQKSSHSENHKKSTRKEKKGTKDNSWVHTGEALMERAMHAFSVANDKFHSAFEHMKQRLSEQNTDDKDSKKQTVPTGRMSSPRPAMASGMKTSARR